MNIYKVDKTCLRYVVPFQYRGTFEEAFQKVEAQKGIRRSGEPFPLWERKTITSETTESDLYDYIRNEFLFDEEKGNLSDQKAGCGWLYERGHRIKKLSYYPGGIKEKPTQESECWQIKIIDEGLSLYRNGLGLIWYEIEFPKGKNSAQLKQFQNEVRELNHRRSECLWEEVRRENGYTPFSIGLWIQKMLDFLDVQYLAERKSAYSNGKMVPDKAILFSYVTLYPDDAEEKGEREKLAYHLTNGYKDSYSYSEELSADMKRPFGNVIWYATQEGAAYLAWPDVDNKEAFDTIQKKVETDYFTLYLKLLYQSFSLMLYAKKIQTEISAWDEEHLDQMLDENVTKLFSEINLFLTKSMATSVSHIHHQSEFYIYLKKQLRIQEDVESVTIGLNALDMLQREKEGREERDRDHEEMLVSAAQEQREKESDEKIQAIMGLFALLGIFSALTDAFDFVSNFSYLSGWKELSTANMIAEIVVMVIVLFISILTVKYAVAAIVKAFKKDS